MPLYLWPTRTESRLGEGMSLPLSGRSVDHGSDGNNNVRESLSFRDKQWESQRMVWL